jgi:hypothetical protein
VTSDGLNNSKAEEIVASFKDKRIIYNEVARVLPEPPFEVGSKAWQIAGYQAVNYSLDQIKKDGCKYVAKLDDDDFWKWHHLEQAKNCLDDNKFKSDFCYSKAAWFVKNAYVRILGEEFCRERFLKENYIAHSTIAYRIKSKHTYHYSGVCNEPSDHNHHKSFLKPLTFIDDASVLYFQRCSVEFALETLAKLKVR